MAESFRDFLARMGETQTSFSRRFEIPLRTVQGWALGERACPEYLKAMAEEILGGAKMTVKDILAEIGVTKDDAWDVIEVAGDLPRGIKEFAEAWNDRSMNTDGSYAEDISPGSAHLPVRGAYTFITVDFEEFNRFFDDGCAPDDLADSFPRTIIAIEKQ